MSSIRVLALMGAGLLLGGCALASAPAPREPLTQEEQVRQKRCAERGGFFRHLEGRWHCLSKEVR